MSNTGLGKLKIDLNDMSAEFRDLGLTSPTALDRMIKAEELKKGLDKIPEQISPKFEAPSDNQG